MDARDPTIASRPAYLFLLLVIGLHFTVGSLAQVANPAFGIAFGELFFFVGITLIFTRAQNFRAVPFLALRPPPASTLLASAGVGVAGFFTAGAINAINRLIVGPEIAARYDVTPLFEVRSPWEGLLLVVGVTVLAPIGEELAFRGYLLRVLAARHGHLAGLLVTASLFAVIHFNPASVVALFALGLVFGLLRLSTGSVWPAVLAHAIQNGTSSALVLTGAAAESPDELPLGSALLLLAVAAPVLWLSLRYLHGLPRAFEGDAAARRNERLDHRFRLREAKGLVAGGLLGMCAASLALLAIDGPAVRERIERARARQQGEAAAPTPAPAPIPAAEQTPRSP